MQLMLIGADSGCKRVESQTTIPPGHFLWIDARNDDPCEPWRDLVEDLGGVRIFDSHLTDATNESHPSFFDATSTYQMVVFRGVIPDAEGTDNPAHQDPDRTVQIDHSSKKPRVVFGPINTQPKRIKTYPVTFFLLDNLLVTVRPADASSIGHVRERMLAHAARVPLSAEDLAHRILNAMVDRYLELRQPLSDRLDRLQRNLLDPKRPFNDWYALLDQRTELRKLEHLCEEQHDAIQEWRDSTLDETYGNGSVKESKRQRKRSDAMMVRITDLLEHINRVRNHAERLESTAESAVQLHFSAMSHRTSEIMRTLTILTAIFLPLTLLTGVFGMNFKQMPLLENEHGFSVVVLIMVGIAVTLLFVFRQKRYIETRSERGLPERK
jgi:magnesium transporter